MLDVAGGAAFLIFVLAAMLVWIPGPPAGHRRRVNALLAVLLVVSATAGLTQRNLWPFSSWPLVAGTLNDEVSFGRILAVDSMGVAHDVDYRAWQPLGIDELMSWLDLVYPGLPPDRQHQTIAHLLQRAETGRAHAHAGGRVGVNDRLLGPLTAPYFILHPAWWTDPSRVSARPFERIRYVRDTWRLSEGPRGPSARRRTVFAYPER